jgi:hypothetical protein
VLLWSESLVCVLSCLLQLYGTVYCLYQHIFYTVLQTNTHTKAHTVHSIYKIRFCVSWHSNKTMDVLVYEQLICSTLDGLKTLKQEQKCMC